MPRRCASWPGPRKRSKPSCHPETRQGHPPSCPAQPRTHLLPHELLKLLLGSFHRPQVVQLHGHLSTGRPSCCLGPPRASGPQLQLGHTCPLPPPTLPPALPPPRPEPHPERRRKVQSSPSSLTGSAEMRRGMSGREGIGQDVKGKVIWALCKGTHLDLLRKLLPCEQASVPPGHRPPLAPVPLAAALGMLRGCT